MKSIYHLSFLSKEKVKVTIFSSSQIQEFEKKTID